MPKKTIGKRTAKQNKKPTKIADLTARPLRSDAARAVKGGTTIMKVLDKTTPN